MTAKTYTMTNAIFWPEEAWKHMEPETVPNDLGIDDMIQIALSMRDEKQRQENNAQRDHDRLREAIKASLLNQAKATIPDALWDYITKTEWTSRYSKRVDDYMVQIEIPFYAPILINYPVVVVDFYTAQATFQITDGLTPIQVCQWHIDDDGNLFISAFENFADILNALLVAKEIGDNRQKAIDAAQLEKAKRIEKPAPTPTPADNLRAALIDFLGINW